MRQNMKLSGTMIMIMVFVTIWSAMDGGRSTTMMIVASVAAVAGMMVLGQLGAMLPETRLSHAAFTALWVFLYAPVWDWLALRFTFPGSIMTAAAFALVFGALRYVISPRGPSRPPS